MTFNAEEKIEIEKLFACDSTIDNLETKLPDELLKFLQKRQYLHTISDKIIWRDSNRFRPFSSCIITKFLHEKIDIVESLEKLVNIIDLEYLIFVDFHFIVTCPLKDTDETDFIDEIDDSNRVFKFQKASKASAFNSKIKISSTSDIKSFLEPLKNFDNSDFLKTAFENHCDIFNLHGSDIRPLMLLSLVVHVQKIF